MRKRYTTLLCARLRRLCTRLRRLCSSLRRSCTSLRRQTTFALTCLCVIIGMTLLFLTSSFQNTSVDNAKQILSLNVQQFIRNHNKIRTINHPEKNKRSLSELLHESHMSDSLRGRVEFRVHANNFMPKLNKYDEAMNASLQTTREFNDYGMQSYSTKSTAIKNISNNYHILNSDLYVNDSSSVQQITKEVLELIHSYIPEAQWQQEKPTLQSLTKFKHDSQRILQLLSNAIPSNERVSLSQVLLQILSDKTVTSFQKYANKTLFNKILHNIRTYTTTFATAHKDNHNLSLARRYNKMNVTNLQVTRDDETQNVSVPNHSRNISKQSLLEQLHYSTEENGYSSALTGKTLGVQDVSARLVNGIYWSDFLEGSIPKGVSDEEADEWIQRSRSMHFRDVEAASWNKCGRPKNAFAVHDDGSRVCVRYRSPNDRLLQGEVMSYWLARLLELDNVPPVHLSSIDSQQWTKLRHRFLDLGWTQGNFAATIMWIQEIDSQPEKQVVMPSLMLKAYREKQPIDEIAFKSFTEHNDSSRWSSDAVPDHVVNTAVSLAQWGSMIIFDYLTANYDRVASMQDGAYKENKSSIIEESIRNLRSSEHENKLWLIDNESGLIDAYDLMYRSQQSGQRFVKFHEDMLRTMCIFQRRVVQQLRSLHRQGRAHITLEKWAEHQEPMLKLIERDSSYELFKRHFSHRVGSVFKWIRYCEKKADKR